MLTIDLCQAQMRSASSLDLLDSARARGRSEEFIEKLEAAHARDKADLDRVSRRFVQAYFTEHGDCVSKGEILWKTQLED
jgi:hypothetical protein